VDSLDVSRFVSLVYSIGGGNGNGSGPVGGSICFGMGEEDDGGNDG